MHPIFSRAILFLGLCVAALAEEKVVDDAVLATVVTPEPATKTITEVQAVRRAEKVNGPDSDGFFGANARSETITLQQAIQWALENNLESKFEEMGVRVEDARTRFEVGAFDPILSVSASRQHAKTPDNVNNIGSTDSLQRVRDIEAQVNAINASVQSDNLNRELEAERIRAIQIATGQTPTDFNLVPVEFVEPPDFGTTQIVIFEQDSDRVDASLSGRTPIGTRFAFSTRTIKQRQTFVGDERDPDPTYLAGTSFEMRQPLLKDFGPAANLVGLRIARKNRDAQNHVWKFRIENTLQQVVSNYYDMALGVADMNNKADAIVAGIKLLSHNRRWQELGFFSPFEVQQAKVQLSFDRENLLQSKIFFVDRQVALKRLILPQINMEHTRVFLPVKIPSLPRPNLDRTALMIEGLANRQDYKAVIAQAEAQDVRLKFAENQAWPQLDLVGSYGWNGLDRSYSAAFDRMGSGNAPQWTIGVQGSMPLGNIQPRAQLDAARNLKQQALIRVKQSELDISVAVERAASAIETNTEKLRIARETTKHAGDAVRVGYRRFEEGLITNFDLIEQQRRQYEARSRELVATADLNRSITQLWLATGTVMKHLDIEIVDAKTDRKRQVKTTTKTTTHVSKPESKATVPVVR